jgi:RHS repeat-associated protein
MDNFILNGYVQQLITGVGVKDYRYGFNGKEEDNETYGQGNEYDYGSRIYNPRLGRWLSIDPFANKYPSLSPFNFVVNNPVLIIDLAGQDFFIPDGTLTEAVWETFKSIIEKRFNGLITIGKTQFEKTSALTHPGLKKGEKYLQVNMTVNEEKLVALAQERAGPTASADIIATKRKEILNELTNNSSYKNLDKVINGPDDALYILADVPGGSFGAASWGFHLGPQNITINNIVPFDNIPGLSAFNQVLHEIMEGYYIYAGKYFSSNEFDKNDPYQYGHWSGLLDQAADLKIAFLYSDVESRDFPKPADEDGWLIVNTFRKLNNNQYEKTTYKIRMLKGDIVKGTDGKPEYSSTKKKISTKQYNSEKNAEKKKLRGKSG